MEDLAGSLTRRIQTKFSLDKLLFYFSVNVLDHVTKKNNRNIFINRKTGRLFPGKSRRLIGAEEFLTLSLREQALKQKLIEPLNEPIWLISHFYFPENVYFTKKNTISLKLPDLSNLYELPQDCLQQAGILANDTLIHSHDLSRRLPGPSYKIELFLLKFDVSS